MNPTSTRNEAAAVATETSLKLIFVRNYDGFINKFSDKCVEFNASFCRCVYSLYQKPIRFFHATDDRKTDRSTPYSGKRPQETSIIDSIYISVQAAGLGCEKLQSDGNQDMAYIGRRCRTGVVVGLQRRLAAQLENIRHLSHDIGTLRRKISSLRQH